jgi:hypothetical protein
MVLLSSVTGELEAVLSRYPKRGGTTITIDMNFCELCISCRDCHRDGLKNGRHPLYGKISVDEFIESIHLACLFTINIK